ncbi:MAG: transketolase C-terminal domain-containing protein, partial [candidate division WOR-3 bacterium]
IQKNRKDIIEYEEVMLDDAEIVVVSFGITARAALKAVREARKKGIKAGLFRLITIWPFPEERIAEISKKIEKFVVAEINQGQVRREVERARVNSVPVIGVHKLGGELITPDEILEGIWKKQN